MIAVYLFAVTSTKPLLLMKKFCLLTTLLFVIAASHAQLPMLENFPELLPPPPGPPDACDMGGTYSVGPGGDYATITEALDTLKARGVSTNVILELNNSYNSSTETFPIVFPKDTEIPCFGGTFSLILRPAAGVSNIAIHGGSNSTILRLDSCSYVTIDGRAGGTGNISSLSILNDSAGNAVDFYDASDNSIIYTSLSSSASVSGNVIFFYSQANGSGCNSNSIKNCKIFSSVVASTVKPVLFYSLNGTSGGGNSMDTVENCEFYNFSQSAISIEDNAAGGWYISGNSFYKSASYSFTAFTSIINIVSLFSQTPHIIENNFFGGTASNCSGGVMDIGYKTSFKFVHVGGIADIYQNKFAKLYFHNDTLSESSNITLLDVYVSNNIVSSNIHNNQFGGTDVADSIHVINNNNTIINETYLYGIRAESNSNTYYITGNYFSGIKSYGESAYVTLVPVQALNGGCVITQNRIGDPSVINSIMNAGPGFTYPVWAVSTSAKINDNTICRIKNTNTSSNGGVFGIYVQGGSIDSICNNKIFHLEHSQQIAGIYAYPQSNGGLHNLIEGNRIHSFAGNSSEPGGKITGILSRAYLTITGNFIHNLSSNSNFATSVCGIQIPDKESVLQNNMIDLGTDSTGNNITEGNISFLGIDGGHVVDHNSVYIGGAGVEDGFLGSACYIFIVSALNAEYHNNIFVNNRSNANASSSAKHQCIDVDLSYTGNYNMFYANGQGGILGTYQNTRYNTLAQWQSGSGKDANSFFEDPNYIQPAAPASAVNLHLSYGSPAESAGSSNYTVATDFDNEPRASLTPVDIGADAGNYAVCPVADAGPDYFLFEGGDVHLGSLPVPNVSYLWRGPDGFTSTLSNPIITPVISGQYTLIVTSGSCSDSDFVHITVMPALTSTLCPGSNSFLIADNASAVAYQWQVNTGNNIYSNISNNSNYNGVNNDTLSFINLPSAWYGYKYRCVADGISGMAHKLQFKNTWTGAVDNFWSNPANWSCSSVPDGNTDVIIDSGTVVLDQDGTCRTLYVAPGVTFTINTGISLIITH